MDASHQLRNFQQLKELKFDDEKYKTATSIEQVRFIQNRPHSPTTS